MYLKTDRQKEFLCSHFITYKPIELAVKGYPSGPIRFMEKVRFKLFRMYENSDSIYIVICLFLGKKYSRSVSIRISSEGITLCIFKQISLSGLRYVKFTTVCDTNQSKQLYK